MKRKFYKYEGAGNDFVLFDHRNAFIDHNDRELIRHLCDRRRGIGGDGLILLEFSEGKDFHMVYFNADGNQSSMCGNGGRCIVAFANMLGLIDEKTEFLAIDGIHHGEILPNGRVTIKMSDVEKVIREEEYFEMDTGSPHYVKSTSDLTVEDIEAFGRSIRYSASYLDQGINVNLMEIKKPDFIKVETYERGVEAETLACGTGVTACAIASYLLQGINTSYFSTEIQTKGNDLLEVKFQKKGTRFVDVWLTGPATFVFSGEVDI